MTIIDRRGLVVGDTTPGVSSTDPSANIAIKTPVRVATTANITLVGLQTIDGVTLAADDRVLVCNQSNAVENGIYLASTGNWTRTSDFDSSREVVKGTLVYINEGTLNGAKTSNVTASDPVVPDTTSMSFSTPYSAQPLDATLTALAALTIAAGVLIQTGPDTFTKRTLTPGSAIAITNGDGVSGNPSIALDIAGLTADATPDAAADYVVTYDASAAGYKKVLLNKIGGVPGGSNTQLQYNNTGAFGGISGATTDGTTVTLTDPKISRIYGGTAAGSSVTIQSTSNGSPSGDSIVFKTGGLSVGGFGLSPFANTTFVVQPDGTNARFAISDTSLQLHYDNIVLGKAQFDAGSTGAPNITWKTVLSGNPNVVFGSITGQNATSSNHALVLSTGGQGNHGNPFEIWTEDGSNVSTLRMSFLGGTTPPRIGIGAAPSFTDATAALLHIHNATSAAPAITRYTNGTTGVGSSDGSFVGVGSTGTGDLYVWNYENSTTWFSANNVATAKITTAGLTILVGDLLLTGSSSGAGTLRPPAAASTYVWTLPAATDTLVGKATTDTFTNKTYDTAGAGNSFSINGVAVTANTGTGAVARAGSPTFTTQASISNTAAGSGLAYLIVNEINTSSGETHTAKFATQDDNAGVIRCLYYCPGPLNAGTPNQGRFDMVVENGSLFISALSSLASNGGAVQTYYDRSGNVKLTLHTNGASTFAGGSFGYGTGVGGTQTQTTSRTTTVTLNKICGAITTDTTSLSAGSVATFTVSNSTVGANDTVILSIKSGQTNKETKAYVSAVAASSFDITVHNQHATVAETGAIVMNFAVIKSVTS